MKARPCRQPTISVAAGKGGTGKTLIATSVAVALNGAAEAGVELLDCDVEEPNADLLLHPEFEHREVVPTPVPEVDTERCTGCGLCGETCQFSAIAVIRGVVIPFGELCAGCGACRYVCPEEAIREVPRELGVVDHGVTAEGIALCQGRVNVGEQRTSRLTKAVKRHVQEDRITILDAPPGTACPMQETVEGSDYCILVTEPTPFGRSDLEAAVETCRQLGVPCGVIVNREGVGDGAVDAYCREAGIPVLLRVPQERAIAEAYAQGRTLAAAFPEWVGPLRETFARCVELMGEPSAVSQTAGRSARD